MVIQVTLLVLADGEHWIPSVKWHTPVVDKLDVKIALQMIRLIRMSNLEVSLHCTSLIIYY